jgi:type VI secretion system secreted protein VgrG
MGSWGREPGGEFAGAAHCKLGEQPLDLELHYHYDDLSPVPGAPYKVTFENGR